MTETNSSCMLHPRVDSVVGTYWSSFFNSIRNDINEIKNTVSEGANELYTYVKESVPESGFWERY